MFTGWFETEPFFTYAGINHQFDMNAIYSRRYYLCDKFIVFMSREELGCARFKAKSKIRVELRIAGIHMEAKVKLRPLSLLFLPLLAFRFLLCSPTLSAKPKVDVKVVVNDGIGKNVSQDSLSRTGGAMDGALGGTQVFYLNVTVHSDNAEAVAKNNGQWCIKGDALLGSLQYHGTLSGNDLELEVPQPNGKIKKMTFVVYDHKWRKLSDM